MLTDKKLPTLDPNRFQTAKATLLIDRFMTHFIKLGGVGIIAAVFGIFIFIFAMTLPLFGGAKISPDKTFNIENHRYAILGADEWGELPFLIDEKGFVHFVDLIDNGAESTVNPFEGKEKEISAVDYIENSKRLVYGTKDGHFSLVTVSYKPEFQGDIRKITATLEVGDFFEIAPEGAEVLLITMGETEDRKLVVALTEKEDVKEVHAVRIVQENSLFSKGEPEIDQTYKLTDFLESEPVTILVNSQADEIMISTVDGSVYYFVAEDDQIGLRQIFKPFSDLENPQIETINFVLGEVSLVLTSKSGEMRIFSLFVPEGGAERLFAQTKTFDPLKKPATFFNASLRNKTFLIGSDNYASLRHSTTEVIRWESKMPFDIQYGIIGGKYDRMIFLDQQNKLHIYKVKDPHPEAGFRAFFSKIWYEGYSEPSYEWQSTGGTDDFEPKLSLIPLIIGTLKGTFFAMFFAIPIALLAAVYTSQFAHLRFRSFIKPTMEIMASLPSVVLGFLAALWLAPLIETRVPSLIMVIIILPVVSMATGYFWSSLPIEKRKHIKSGYEWIALFPVLFLGTYIAWSLGPVVERLFFVVTDPETGIRTADFRLWWPHVTGASFEQRNSLVVGFMMGFAVIPIIFTIAEDALSNVPRTLVSGSLALGASRWQTALKVVLPTAFPGIFSALMVGLGRAVGETMIVVMATGNTPVMDFNIFTGMRTLSANIAVELPEAPYLGTLYRALFLGALALFLMTFVVNTIAEVIRQKLREKYKTV